jgi:U3 small nucleolar RNA-associated protein 13
VVHHATSFNADCVDPHFQVWALAVSNDERTIVSGAADSVVTFWEDCTEENEQAKEAERADMVLK